MAETSGEQPLVINTQYIKDLSFENPNAPEVFAAFAETPPDVNVNIDVTSAHLGERTYEVVLSFRVGATTADQAAFLIELDYAGIATIADSVPEAELEPLLLSETPRHLFPFARSTLAAVTRDGGFPPLVVNPIDFEQFYLRHKKGTLRTAEAKAAAPGS
ncbi:MAG: protein-export chaperone SecB [Kiloniellaceae bacterium]